jgi:general secretion pathway protein I
MNWTDNWYARTAGFTLLEVMVALAILAIGLSAILGSQQQSVFTAQAADFMFTAATLADEKMAEIERAGNEPFGGTGAFEEHPGYTWELIVDYPQFDDITYLADAREILRRIELRVSDSENVFTLNRYLLVGLAQ